MAKVPFKLDYSLTSMEERIEFCRKLLEGAYQTTYPPYQLDYLANYIFAAMPKEERKEHRILTDNRLYTINLRETSYEGLASILEKGEDGIPELTTTNKHQYLTPRKKITEKDMEVDVSLKEINDTIKNLEKQLVTAEGHTSFVIKKHIIELHQMKYTIKQLENPPVRRTNTNAIYWGENHPLVEEIKVSENGDSIEVTEGVSIVDATHVAAILSLYNELMAESEKNPNSDVAYLMEEFNKIFKGTFKEQYPTQYRIAELKIQGVKNSDIHNILKEEEGVGHTAEYISSIWTKKIPKIISDIAIDEYIYWYYTTQKPGIFKKCSLCGQIKLRNSRYFSKNHTSKDGYYSQCKDCRNAKDKEKQKRYRWKIKEEARNAKSRGEVKICQTKD